MESNNIYVQLIIWKKNKKEKINVFQKGDDKLVTIDENNFYRYVINEIDNNKKEK